ncbi:MAG: GNAT family N-acetyltransferase [Firmicutes bacterium]|nr:GNAT family N-acetyltransferase [Lachnospiraceae bacterium]MBQ7058025.1 GNAT family N-acetyltransferase [Bacillota bacterium]
MKELFSEIPYIQGEKLVLKRVTEDDAQALSEMAHDPQVYRFLPTFLFERRYEDAHEVIRRLYDECFQESVILGIYRDGIFCGLAEMYGYKDHIRRISIGCRLRRQCWGQGIAAEAVRMMVRYLHEEADIETITASTMVENRAVTRVVQKCGFELVSSGEKEDWGYAGLISVNKWIKTI